MTQPESSAVAWDVWALSPDIVIPTALVLIVYAVGLKRRPGTFDAKPWRSLAFIWGVVVVFLSLASPIDALADHLFFMHQVQHMLLRVVGPMLIALSQPQGLLVAGMPRPLRRIGLMRAVGHRAVRACFGFLTDPWIVTALFVGSLYVWQWPRLHNIAILNEGVHYAMHVTMLAAGLLFFWRVFDHRPMPKGTPYGARLMMLWIAVLSNIPIGAYTTFKTRELYPAYDVAGRLLGISAMNDEGIGGFIMWAPSSMMMLLAVLLVIHAWAIHETRQDEQRLAAEAAGAAPKPLEAGRPKNRALALGLVGFAACVLAATFAIGVLSLHGGTRASVARTAALAGGSPPMPAIDSRLRRVRLTGDAHTE